MSIIVLLCFLFIKVKTKKYYFHIKPLFYIFFNRKKNKTWFYFTVRYNENFTKNKYLCYKIENFNFIKIK